MMWIDRSTEGAPGRMYVGEDRCHFFSVGAGDSIGAPGMMKAFLQGTSDEGGSPSLSPMNALAVPEFVDAKARLTRMDEQGVESCLMLPTIGAGQVLNGSDYPHPEGLADPIEFVEELTGLNDPEIKPIMRDNFASLVA
jgi:hypothetical protein